MQEEADLARDEADEVRPQNATPTSKMLEHTKRVRQKGEPSCRTKLSEQPD